MEKKHHARTLPHTGHVKNSDEGSPDFVVGQSFLECVVFLSSRHCFYFFPDMDRKNLCCACSAWSGFSVARTFFRPVYNTSTGSVSDRWYVKSRQKRFVSGNLFQKSSAKRFEKTCQSGTIFPFIKISATEKTWITIFVFKKDGGQDKAILSKVNKCRVVFRPPESGPRRLRHHLFVVFCYRHFLFL
jgi:hypothetical protein